MNHFSKGDVSKSSYRWVVVALVTLIMFINYIDRSAIGYAAGPLMADLKISPIRWGMLTSAFAIGYLVFNFAGGLLVDRSGPKLSGILMAMLWAASSALVGASTGVAMLFAARLLLGVAEGPGFPTAAQAVRNWLPAREMGRAVSLYTGIGVPFSLLVGAPLVTMLIATYGWRSMFWILVGLTLAWVIVWTLLFTNWPERNYRVSQSELNYIVSEREDIQSETATPWYGVLRSAPLMAMFFAYFGWGYAYWTFVYWLPEYLYSAYKIDILRVGMLSSLPWLAATITTLAGGWFVDWLFRRTGSRYKSRSLVLGVCLILTALSMLPVIFFPSLFNAILSVTLGMGFGWFAGSCWWLIPIEIFPQRPALATGFITTGTALAGIVSPIVTGWLIEKTGTLHSTFVLMMAFMLLAAVTVLTVVRFDRNLGAEARQ